MSIQLQEVIQNIVSKIVSMLLYECLVEGSPESNLGVLKWHLSGPFSSPKACHYKAIYDVGTFILSHGPLVKTQEAGTYYLKYNGLEITKCSYEYYKLRVVSRHLNLI